MPIQGMTVRLSMPDKTPLIVPISKARRILGKQADDLLDDQVQELIHTMHLLAKEHLMYSSSKVMKKGKK